jgi:hypothetical protein
MVTLNGFTKSGGLHSLIVVMQIFTTGFTDIHPSIDLLAFTFFAKK